MTTLFDASSIWDATQRKSVDHIVGEAATNLTPYELGNILLKHVQRGIIKGKEADEMQQALNRLLDTMSILRRERVESETLAIAENAGLTYYDASYVSAALFIGAELVTEDKDLFDAARRYGVTSRSLKDL